MLPEPAGPPWERRFVRALTGALETRAVPGPRSILFSGGLDSGLLAWELREEAGLTLSTVGLPGSHDLHVAEAAARELSLPWVGTTLTPAELTARARWVDGEAPGLSATARSVEVAFALAVANASPGEIVCGQGADELFHGYAHFRGLPSEAARDRAEADLAYLLREAWPRSVRLAARLGRTLTAPFLDPEVLSAVAEIPAAELATGPIAKQALRTFAHRQGVPRSIVDRPKKALQYGTGVDRWLRRLAAGAVGQPSSTPAGG